MGRTIVVRKSRPENIQNHLVRAQEARFNALVLFCNEIADEEVQDAARTDDQLFANIVRLACFEYGITLAGLGKEIAVTGPGIGRWSIMRNLPPSYTRPTTIAAIVRILREHIAGERKRAEVCKLKRIPYVYSGVCATKRERART